MLVEADLVKPAERTHVSLPDKQKVSPHTRPGVSGIREVVQGLLKKLQTGALCALQLEAKTVSLSEETVSIKAPKNWRSSSRELSTVASFLMEKRLRSISKSCSDGAWKSL